MADSPAAAASPTLPQAHEEEEPKPKPAAEAETGADATNDDAGEEDGGQDTASVKTTTADLFPEYGADAPSGPESKQHKLGLDINKPWGWDGSSYNDYDVVTVHGIRDDYRTAWTDARGAWWVKDALFQNLSIREVDYSYEIDSASTLYEPNGIVQHARRLIIEYAAVRQKLDETETDRPIIWICHDLGGTMVKEALYIAMHNPARYGNIAILTTAIIFLGTPHRFQSTYDLEDQLCKLILLPGPQIEDGTLSKVTELARQVTSVNQRFLATKILDRAAIFNLFTQNKLDSAKQNRIDENSVAAAATSVDGRDEDDDAADPVTPFRRYAHHLGHSFEAVGRFGTGDVDHVALIRGEQSGNGFLWLSDLFNVPGFDLRVKYRILHSQARLLSLAPPTRALDSPFNPVLPKPTVVKWIHEQEPCVTFSKPGGGLRLLQLHANGNPLVDISRVSRLFYLDYDSSATVHGFDRLPKKTMVYFEFDQHDSRYNTISSLLLYLLNVLAWRFWVGTHHLISTELAFLSHVNAWSLEDLFHLYSMLRRSSPGLTIFISCFDQCPADQRQWFLERVLEEQSYRDNECRIVLSTSAHDDLVVASFPDEARINLDDSPALCGSRDSLTEELRSGLSALITRRPIYEDLRPQLESLLEKCGDVPYLGHIILSWLGIHHRGKPKSEIRDNISKLLPPTAENIVRVFIASLAPALRKRGETVFNWVKNAAEPWSLESLTEALAVHELGGVELSFEDLDVEGTMSEIEEAFGGIIALKDGDVKFSHASFYHAPEVGFEESGEEAAAKANSTIAETCLRYFQLSCAQEALAEFSRKNSDLEGFLWVTPLDSAMIFHPRTSMAEYAVRFWHQHYKVSGRFKPRKLVNDLFAGARARAGWEVPFWLLSNPFTRMKRSYISTLPVLAMLGLEDLVQEKVQNERGQRTFEKDCWFAITEAARAGQKAMVQHLLGQVAAVDEEELQMALHWAAARGDPGIVNVLLDKIPNLETFHWPDNMMHQAAAAGLDDLLAAMSLSGCNINQINEIYWGASPAVIVARRKRVSTMEFLLGAECKPDLTIKDTSAGDDPLMTAAVGGNPRMIEVLLQGGASVETKDDIGKGPVQRAAGWCGHKAIDALIKAKADFKSGTPRPAVVIAAKSGSQQCVRVLLAHGADPDAEVDGVTALYEAVSENHVGVVWQLLTHNPKPDMDKTPTYGLKLLMRAVGTRNAELVSLLLDHSAEVDFVDPNAGGYNKTPLSQACAQGSLEIVKLLLAKGANINYTGDASDAPLLAAVYADEPEVARHLLQDETVDVKWAATDGTTALHVAFQEPGLIAELLIRGAPIDAHSFRGTALHRAAQSNSPKAIEALLANDPKPEVDIVCGGDSWTHDDIGFTPLQLACKYNFPKCVKALLKGGANPKLKNKNGDDVVDILLRTESDSNNALECLRLLLSVPFSVTVDEVDRRGRTRLHGIQKKTPFSVVQLLVEAHAPFDLQDQEGHSPLSVAVSKGNESVIRYLVKQGASVNRCSPSFGSILHLAVSRGDLNIARFLVDSGAELEAVDPEYGDSVLYTALGIEDPAKLKAMVRYLVDEARVPINKLGGVRFGYPIIRAANLVRTNHSAGTQVLKFLIRRNAQLDVADGQGRCAVHVACASRSEDAIKTLIRAGAKIDVKDAVGRKPIHFAASAPYRDCFGYLMDTFKDTDVNEADYDKWTPLMWAARSGSVLTLNELLERDADIWARGCGSDAKEEWSALKLLNFSGRTVRKDCPQLEPKERTRVRPDEEPEQWDDAFHTVGTGDLKDATCDSCFVAIRGKQWKCISCNNDFSLCFKCFGRQSTIHNPEHEFEELGPLYRKRTPSPVFNYSDDSDDMQELPPKVRKAEDVENSGDAAAAPRDENPSEVLEFNIDTSNEEG